MDILDIIIKKTKKMECQGIELLKQNHAGSFIRKDAKQNDSAVNYGVIRVEEQYLIFWTNKALLHMFGSQERTNELKSIYENQLIKDGYIEMIRLDNISRIIF